MKVVPFIYNDRDDLAANSYIVIDSNNNCIVVDPGCDYDGLVNYIKNNSLNLKAILLTHCHFDHIGGVDQLVDAYNCDVYIHNEDVEGLTDISINLCETVRKVVFVKVTPKELFDGDMLNILEEPIKVIHTPYHTLGSSCYYFSNSKLLFSGDSLFKMMIGRADLPNSCRKYTKESLNKLMLLPDDVKVYPGHGVFTTIGFEKEKNPFIKRA